MYRRLMAWGLLLCVLLLVGCGGTSAPPPSNEWSVDISGIKKIGSRLFKTTVSDICNGAVSAIGSSFTGWILGLIFGQDKSQEILDKLQMMDGKLDKIISQLNVISGKLDQLLGAIQSARDDIIANNETLAMKVPIDTIQENFGYLSYYKMSADDTQADLQNNAAKAEKFASDILDSRALDIPLTLYSIHSGITGALPGRTKGALESWTDVLIDKANAGQDLMSCYLTLEYYFGELLAVQAKGLNLVVEALHLRESSSSRLVGRDYPGTADQYINQEFKPRIETQADLFLQCVERLVVSQVDLTASPPMFLPSEAHDIFARADFVAAQCSDAFGSGTHPYGLVGRVIGEPATVNDCGKHFQSGPTYGAPTLTLDRIGDVRLYPASQGYAQWLPQHQAESYCSQYGWTVTLSEGVRFKFNRADSIAVARYHMAISAPGDFTVQIPYGPSYVTKAVYYDDTFTPAQSGDLYASFTLPARFDGDYWYVDPQPKINPTPDPKYHVQSVIYSETPYENGECRLFTLDLQMFYPKHTFNKYYSAGASLSQYSLYVGNTTATIRGCYSIPVVHEWELSGGKGVSLYACTVVDAFRDCAQQPIKWEHGEWDSTKTWEDELVGSEKMEVSPNDPISFILSNGLTAYASVGGNDVNVRMYAGAAVTFSILFE